MSDHVETLEAVKNHPELNEGGTILAMVGDAIRALLEENERLRNEMKLMIPLHEASAEHQKLNARIEAALALHKRGMNPQNQLYCMECRRIGWPCHSPTVKALRGEE